MKSVNLILQQYHLNKQKLINIKSIWSESMVSPLTNRWIHSGYTNKRFFLSILDYQRNLYDTDAFCSATDTIFHHKLNPYYGMNNLRQDHMASVSQPQNFCLVKTGKDQKVITHF